MKRFCTFYAAAALLVLPACEKQEGEGMSAIQFEVMQEPARTRVMVGDDTTLQNCCTPVADGGLGQSIGLWAAMTDAAGRTVNDVFSGVRLRWVARAGGHEDNPDADEEDVSKRQLWNTVITDGGSEREGEVYWRPGETYRFRAYYPAGVELRENTSATTFIAEYRADQRQDDMMAAYQKVALNTLSDLQQHVQLTMKHMLSAVKFTFRFADDFPTTDYLTGVWLENTASGHFFNYGLLVYGDGTEAGAETIQWYSIYAPREGEKMYEWTTSPGYEFSNSVATRATAYGAAGTVSGALYTDNDNYIYMIPQALPSGTDLCFTTRNSSGFVFRVALPTSFIDAASVAHNTLEPGWRYQFNVVISQLNVELYITIKPWNELDSSYTINF